MEVDEITGAVVTAAIQIHKDIGPGLFESVYEVLLARSLHRRGFRVDRQRSIGFAYDGIVFEQGFRLDLLVEDGVIVEIKSLDRLAPVHSKQVLTYLRLMNLPVGLLLNFGAERMIDGVKRVLNDRPH
jgi:GxxExxY protein